MNRQYGYTTQCVSFLTVLPRYTSRNIFKEVSKVLKRKALDHWMSKAVFTLVLTAFLLGNPTAEAWLFQDPKPRVVETKLPVPESTRASNTTYIVRNGDTLSDIARKYQADLGQLISLNGIKNPNVLSIGQVLQIPAIGAGDRQPVIYQVKRGDTLSGIATQYGIDMDILIKHNGIQRPDRLQIGQQLVIPVGGAVPAMGTTSMVATSVQSAVSFDWPTEGVITSKFGRRWGEFHYGLDVANDMGTPIKAAAGGVVIFADWRGTYGKAIIIQHDEVYRTLYAHNDQILVEEGQWVARGQVIAKMGSTGRSTGPHLHFEVHQNQKALDPLRFLQ